MAKEITPIGDIVKNVFEQIESGKTLTREDVEERWRELVGEVGAKHSKLLSLRKTVLNVTVDSSVWLHELAMKKRTLLKGLKSMFGKDKISEIHFKIGEL